MRMMTEAHAYSLRSAYGHRARENGRLMIVRTSSEHVEGIMRGGHTSLLNVQLKRNKGDRRGSEGIGSRPVQRQASAGWSLR